MTNVTELLRELRALDVNIRAEGDRLRLNAPKGALTSELRSAIASHKEEILAYLNGLVVSQTGPRIVRREHEGPIPLSFAQKRLWLLEQMDPGQPTYNMPLAVRLRGSLDAEAMARSLDAIVARHDILRTTYCMQNGVPYQEVFVPRPGLLQTIDLSHLPPTEREAAAKTQMQHEADEPFDLERDLPVRATLIRLDGTNHLLLITMHHIASDGWSFGVLQQELAHFYQRYGRHAVSVANGSELPPLPIQYHDYAIWQDELLERDQLQTQLDYWKEQLGGEIPHLDVPTDYIRPPVRTFSGARVEQWLSPELAAKVHQACRQENVTLFMYLLAVFKLLLHRYSGQEDILVGSPIAGRNHAELEKLIGLFLNTLVLRTDLSGKPTFADLLQRIREVSLAAFSHQDVPFEMILEEMRVERDPSRTPFFQVFFNMLNFANTHGRLADLATETIVNPDLGAKFDLTLYINETDKGLWLSIVYNTDLFTAVRMAEFLAQYVLLVEQVIADPHQPLSRYALTTPQAQEITPAPTALLDVSWYGPVHAALERHAAQTPGQTAVYDGQATWTYAELNQRSNRLAHWLRAQQVQPGDVVAVYGYRNASLVWAIMGIHKASAAFLILDPAYPPSRLVSYVEQAEPVAFIGIQEAGEPEPALQQALNKHGCRATITLPPLQTAVSQDFLGEQASHNPDVAIDPNGLAYVAFTSGSTGTPKGILGPHHPLSHFCRWYTQTFAVSAEDNFSMLSGLAHDPLLRDLFIPLWLGATLHVPDPAYFGLPGKLAEWLFQNQVTVAHLTPPLSQLITGSPGMVEALSHLRYAFFGGDRLLWSHVARLRQLAPHVTCVNFYGTTETPQAMGFYVADSMPPANKQTAVPLGKGIDDVQLLILNDSGQVAGVSEAGEIVIRTPYLSQGYINGDEQAAQKYGADPFTDSEQIRIYRTGDNGRYLLNGDVEFIGRRDHQVKIRGFRVELKGIETLLNQHPQVESALVVAHRDGSDDTRLVAYVIGPDEQLSSDALRQHLRQYVPNYMVPAAFVFLEALPLTPNGKIDHNLLPPPDAHTLQPEKEYVPPQDEIERELVKIWEDVLNVQPVGVRDNFFDLGGHSMLALQLFTRIEKKFGRSLPVALLFQAPTVAQLGNILRQASDELAWHSLVSIKVGGILPPFFCVHGGAGHVLHYQELANHLAPQQPFYGLQPQELYGTDNVPTVEQMATHYVSEIRKKQPQGPYYLGGFCFGSIVAFEMAQQLQRAGEEVAVLSLISPSSPQAYRPLKQPETVPGRLQRHREQMAQLGLSDKIRYGLGAGQRRFSTVIERIQLRWQRLNIAVKWIALRLYLVTGRPVPIRFRDFYLLYFVSQRAKASYTPGMYNGRVLMILSARELRDEDRFLAWKQFVDGDTRVERFDVPHLDLFRNPHVARLGTCLQNYLDDARPHSGVQTSPIARPIME